MTRLEKFWKIFLDAVFPPVCIACRRRGQDIVCGNCRDRIEINNSFFCPECNRRLPADPDFLKNSHLCHPEVKFVLMAAAPYENRVVRELVHALKYNRAKTALEPLGAIINHYLEKIIGNWKLSAGGGSAFGGKIENFMIVPLPLHRRKERVRGFNQAELISRVLCYSIVPALTVETGNLVKIKNTESQTEAKDYEERQKNVRSAFAVKSPERIVGRNIILVDDVFTSGATMKEAARVLKEAGARKIIGFVIAKA